MQRVVGRKLRYLDDQPLIGDVVCATVNPSIQIAKMVDRNKCHPYTPFRCAGGNDQKKGRKMKISWVSLSLSLSLSLLTIFVHVEPAQSLAADCNHTSSEYPAENERASYKVNLFSFAFFSPYLVEATALHAISLAAQIWNDEGLTGTFRYIGTTGIYELPKRRIAGGCPRGYTGSIFMDNYCSGGLAGQASVRCNGDMWTIRICDANAVYPNGRPYETDGTGGLNTTSLTELLVHEMGHTLNIDHSDNRMGTMISTAAFNNADNGNQLYSHDRYCSREVTGKREARIEYLRYPDGASHGGVQLFQGQGSNQGVIDFDVAAFRSLDEFVFAFRRVNGSLRIQSTLDHPTKMEISFPDTMPQTASYLTIMGLVGSTIGGRLPIIWGDSDIVSQSDSNGDVIDLALGFSTKFSTLRSLLDGSHYFFGYNLSGNYSMQPSGMESSTTTLTFLDDEPGGVQWRNVELASKISRSWHRGAGAYLYAYVNAQRATRQGAAGGRPAESNRVYLAFASTPPNEFFLSDVAELNTLSDGAPGLVCRHDVADPRLWGCTVVTVSPEDGRVYAQTLYIMRTPVGSFGKTNLFTATSPVQLPDLPGNIPFRSVGDIAAWFVDDLNGSDWYYVAAKDAPSGGLHIFRSPNGFNNWNYVEEIPNTDVVQGPRAATNAAGDTIVAWTER